MNCCNNYQNCNCNTGNLSENNDKLKRELGDFVDLLRERVNDIAYDKNYQNIVDSIADVKLDLNNAIDESLDIVNTAKDEVDAAVATVDALPFEDGVLADTFVTATAKHGGNARQQSEVNGDVVSLLEFDSLQAAQAASIELDKQVFIPNGVHLVDTTDFDAQYFYGLGTLSDSVTSEMRKSVQAQVLDRESKACLSPEQFDYTGALDRGEDAAPAFREMFKTGAALGINNYELRTNRTYHMMSYDPSGVGSQSEKCVAIYLKEVSSNLTISGKGSKIKAYDSIRDNDNPGAIFRIECAFTSTNPDDEKINLTLNDIYLDLKEITAASEGVQSIGGMSIAGRFNVTMTNPVVVGGVTTAVGEDVGAKGGDQAFFFTNSYHVFISNPVIIGMPDLAFYFSNSGMRGATIIGGKIQRCQKGIGVKRHSSNVRVMGTSFYECQYGIYNPVSDGRDNNMGGRFHINNCYFEKMVIGACSINAKSEGSTVTNNTIVDFGRRLSDGMPYEGFGGEVPAIRVRSPNCVISGNTIKLDEWDENPSNFGQIAINFGRNGAVDEGAENCVFVNNILTNLYKVCHYSSGILSNVVKDNIRNNITTMDTDDGDNIYPHRLVKDTMVTVQGQTSRQLMSIQAQVFQDDAPNGVFWVNLTPSPSISAVSSFGADVVFTTNVTVLGDADADKFTISANNDGTISLINRTTGTKLVRVSLL